MSKTPPLSSYADLVALVGKWRAEIAEPQAENAELKRRLGMTSKNSSPNLARGASARRRAAMPESGRSKNVVWNDARRRHSLAAHRLPGRSSHRRVRGTPGSPEERSAR